MSASSAISLAIISFPPNLSSYHIMTIRKFKRTDRLQPVKGSHLGKLQRQKGHGMGPVVSGNASAETETERETSFNGEDVPLFHFELEPHRISSFVHKQTAKRLSRPIPLAHTIHARLEASKQQDNHQRRNQTQLLYVHRPAPDPLLSLFLTDPLLPSSLIWFPCSFSEQSTSVSATRTTKDRTQRTSLCPSSQEKTVLLFLGAQDQAARKVLACFRESRFESSRTATLGSGSVSHSVRAWVFPDFEGSSGGWFLKSNGA